jgi:hypothetical protein
MCLLMKIFSIRVTNVIQVRMFFTAEFAEESTYLRPDKIGPSVGKRRDR